MWISFALLVRNENWMLSAWVIVRPMSERKVAPTVKSSKNGPSVTAADIATSRDGIRRVQFAIAIRAQQIAFRCFLDETRPRARHAVHRDREKLRVRIAVMENERGDVGIVSAPAALPAVKLDKTRLRPTTPFDDRARPTV